MEFVVSESCVRGLYNSSVSGTKWPGVWSLSTPPSPCASSPATR